MIGFPVGRSSAMMHLLTGFLTIGTQHGFRRPVLPLLVRHAHTQTVTVVETRATSASAFATRVDVGGVHVIPSDLKHEERGSNGGASPKELLLSALGSCTSMTIRTFYDNSKSLNASWGELRRITVVLKEVPSDDHPHVPKGIDIQVSLDGDLSPAHVDRLIRAASNCPVKRMLSAGLDITTSLVA